MSTGPVGVRLRPVDETGLRCHVLSTSPVALIEVAGTLRRATSPRLRDAVLKARAHAPDAIILDLAGLDDRDHLSATVLPTLAYHVATLGGELIVAAAPPAVRTAVRQSTPTLLPMFPTREQALHEAQRAPVRRRIVRDLPGKAHATWDARRLIDEMCTRWQLEQLREPAQIIGTELVTNAVNHAGAPIKLCVTVRSYVLRIEVSDPSTAPPVLWKRSPGATMGGFGLWLVEALATRWNVQITPAGKTVWADLILPASHRLPTPSTDGRDQALREGKDASGGPSLREGHRGRGE